MTSTATIASPVVKHVSHRTPVSSPHASGSGSASVSASTSSSSPLPTKSDWNTRVATYNILSTELADPHHHHLSNPDHLTTEFRRRALFQKLTSETNKGTIICLQEASQTWQSILKPFWKQRGYKYRGRVFGQGGWGGVVIAYPRHRFQRLHHRAARIGSLIRQGQWSGRGGCWGWWGCRRVWSGKCRHMRQESCCGDSYMYDDDMNESNESPLPRLLLWMCILTYWILVGACTAICALLSLGIRFQCYVGKWNRCVRCKSYYPAWARALSHVRNGRVSCQRRLDQYRQSLLYQPAWKRASQPANEILGIRLYDRLHSCHPSVCVVTYHMPCRYWDPAVMDIQAYVALRFADEYAENMPLIVAGDWNVRPNQVLYRRLTFQEDFPRSIANAFCGQSLTGGKRGLRSEHHQYLHSRRQMRTEGCFGCLGCLRCCRSLPSLFLQSPSSSTTPLLPLLAPSGFEMRRLSSAYAACHGGREPGFTCYAAAAPTSSSISERSMDENTDSDRFPAAFCDTLDYILIDNGIECFQTDVMSVSRISVSALPTATEPSDHVMVVASLRFVDRGQL